MKEKQHGHIVNITSINERVARADTAVYTGTKHFWTGEAATNIYTLLNKSQERASA